MDEPFRRLGAEGRVRAIEYDGFWVSLDTLKELQLLRAGGDRSGAVGAVADRNTVRSAGRLMS